MAKTGAFTFVLHSHLPYARRAGMWPHGEEWVHEAIAETYVPLLNALYDLSEEGVPWALTVGLTPILAEQLADPLIGEHFRTYAAERASWAAADVDRFEAAGESELRDLARREHHWYARILTSFTDRFGGDLVGAFRALQDAGNLDIATSAATHGYLPLLSRDSSVHGQLHTGVRASTRHFGRSPQSVWLPENAYRPAREATNHGVVVHRPGLESFLAEERLRVFFSETLTVEDGAVVGKAIGDVIGVYGGLRRTPARIEPGAEVGEPGTTYQPYWVGDAPGEVAVLARNNRTGLQVWSAAYGYPGDGAYREFHKKDTNSGMRYWRVGGRDLGLGDKPLYEPAIAQERVRSHADHYVHLVEELLGTYHAEHGRTGVISAAYDTELFGHWWAEGIDWLQGVLRGLAHSETVELANAARIIALHPPDQVLNLPESSWGNNGDHSTWLNDETAWMWPLIHGAERRMEELVAAHPRAGGERERLLNQTARELLLLQSSDWPFLITTGQAKEYAIERFQTHLERFERLARLADAAEPLNEEQRAFLAEMEERDNPFPAINYRDWAERQGIANVAPVAEPGAPGPLNP